MKEYILFDLDGTLLNSMPYHARAWIETFSQFGIEFREEEIYLNEGALELEVVKNIFSKKGRDGHNKNIGVSTGSRGTKNLNISFDGKQENYDYLI